MTHKDIETIQENEQEIDTNLEGDLGAPVDIEKEDVTKHQVLNNVEHAKATGTVVRSVQIIKEDN
jgi:hypothetical protein